MGKTVPIDDNCNVCAAGTDNKTFWAEIQTGADLYKTTTGWDAIILPNGVECKNCIIKMRSFDDAAAVGEDEIPYLFSSEADGTGSIKVKTLGTGARKLSGIIGYVWTGVAGYKISVIVVD